MAVWYGSKYADPYHILAEPDYPDPDPNPAPDPALFVSQVANKNNLFFHCFFNFCLLIFDGATSFFKVKKS